MKELVAKKMKIVSEEENLFREDMENEPERMTTCRNTPFWNKHKAKKLLVKDVQDGVDKEFTIKELWAKRGEYQEFPLDFFRKRIYEIRSKQRAGPYWQAKRNKIALKSHQMEAERLRKEWADEVEILEKFNSMNIGDD